MVVDDEDGPAHARIVAALRRRRSRGPPGQGYPEQVEDPRRLFSTEQIQQARAYHRPLYRVWSVAIALDVATLALIAFTGLGDTLADLLEGRPWWAQTVLLAALVIAITTLITLPLSYWAGFVRERRFGFSTQSAGAWIVDRGKRLALAIVVGSLALLGLVGLARALPQAWPPAAAGAAAGLALALSFVAPVLLEPLFSRFAPLQDEELAASLHALADDAGLPVERVLVADASRRTTKQNAYVSGLGRTRRLVLYDTLLADGAPRELRLVLAHELGHRRAGHLVKGAALAAAAAAGLVVLLWALLRWDALLSALGIDGAGDPAVVPFVLLLATVLQVVAAPWGAALSRRWEREADRISLQLTADAEAFEQMMRKLALANLADLDPPALVYAALFSHPTPPERIAAARAFAA
jgi:STE24 endopeptidase